MKTFRNLVLTALGMSLAVAWSAGASAGEWRAHHPRRVEVNSRLGRQNARIHHDVADGSMTHQQAQQLHREDHTIRHEERFDASLNGSHITKAEQRSLNQQENSVSGQIYQDAH
jgi:hypothetical protein